LKQAILPTQEDRICHTQKMVTVSITLS